MTGCPGAAARKHSAHPGHCITSGEVKSSEYRPLTSQQRLQLDLELLPRACRSAPARSRRVCSSST